MPITSTFGAMAARGFGLFSAIKQAVDEYFEYVTMLLPGNGTNGAQNNTFLDSSTNNFTITRNGNTTQGTFTPYGENWSNYFDGTGDYLTVPSNAALAVGSTFTVECWVYRTVGSTIQWLAGNNAGSGNTNWLLEIEANNTVYGGGWGSGTQTVSTVPVAAWTHIAMVCDSGSLKIYIDGIQSGTAGSGANFTASDITYIGQYSGVSRNLTGYISNLRVLKGTALYTANFTPPTAPLTAITNTSLLLNYTNAGVIDNAMMNNLETVGNAQISTTQRKWGGSSIAFDGTGDYLVTSGSPIYQFGTGDFTIEMWIKTSDTVFAVYDNDYQNFGAYNTMAIYYGAVAGSISWAQGPVSGNGINIISPVSSSVINDNSWHHFAVSRSGTNCRMFLDGTQIGTTGTNSANFNSPNGIWIGAIKNFSGYDFNGYIDDLRITKGYARYTANFTPPGPLPIR